MSEPSAQRISWSPQPEAAQAVDDALRYWTERSEWLAKFQRRLLTETGTRLSDWVERVSAAPGARLEATGWQSCVEPGGEVWIHPQAQLPRLTIDAPARLAIKVESVDAFLLANRFDARTEIVGSERSSLRRAMLCREGGLELHVVERHGGRGWSPDGVIPPGDILADIRRVMRLRRREWPTDAEGFEATADMLRHACHALGTDRACAEFFAAERAYWQSRNRAAQLQRLRQDRLGLGWANHDHHTYRSSRTAFRALIANLELLGMQCREQFHPGKGAGWGAQVLEQPNTGIVVFADVDLSPEELRNDFSHLGLDDRHELSTVGLWCALHGEAFLQAGMHHLEAQFDFIAAREQLALDDIDSMPPFTDLPFLKQCFTTGERWPVAKPRIDRLLADGRINAAQAETFRREGALGSHLELLQRDAGYKGFNQTGIDQIIAATDPRHSTV
jgi:hypothetical protein